jgi:hypothetical protein
LNDLDKRKIEIAYRQYLAQRCDEERQQEQSKKTYWYDNDKYRDPPVEKKPSACELLSKTQ